MESTQYIENFKWNSMIISLIVTIILSGLIAGLFYGFCCAVNPGLGSLDAKGYLKAVQAINVSIINPVFFLSFFGTPLLIAISAYLAYRQGSDKLLFLLITLGLYTIGVLGITIFGNIPLNKSIEAIHTENLTIDQLNKIRANFQPNWNNLHNIRTICSILTFLSLVLSCFIGQNSGQHS